VCEKDDVLEQYLSTALVGLRCSRLLRELKALNSIGVYVTDVKYENYKGRHLVDFSASITEPHLVFREEYRSRSEIMRRKTRNLQKFDRMVKELNIKTTVRAAPDYERIQSLRRAPRAPNKRKARK
jgi:hypothetical protein